jgi:putative ABC transport system permease protein
VNDLFSTILRDVRHSMRALSWKAVITATATLAICIGANTTVFSIVNSILLRPLPYPNSDRLYSITEHMGRDGNEVGIAADYYSMRDENRVFDSMAAFGTSSMNWTGVEKPEQLKAAQVTPSFFRVFGTRPMLGRYLISAEQGPKAPPVVVLSYPFWRSRMASDPHIAGKSILLDGMSWTVVGVMPQGFDYPKGTQVWKPLTVDEGAERTRSPNRPMRLVRMVARLKAEITQRQLETEMSRLTHVIRAEYPKEFEKAGFLIAMNISATSLHERITGDLRPALLVLTGAVALVLLIACANLANLLLARAMTRQRETAVRMALGSGRGRIVKRVLAESLVLAIPGGIAGAVVAALAVRALNIWKPLVLANYPAISVDLPTLAFTFGVTVVTGLIFGLAPAIAAARISIHEALKSSSGTQTGNQGASTARRILLIAELSTSLVLLIGAALLARSFVKLSHTDIGFAPENLLTLRTNLTGSRYRTAQGQLNFYDEVLERVNRLPIVRAAAVSTDIPLAGDGPFSAIWFQIAGRLPIPMAQRPSSKLTVVSRDYFETLRIPLLRGRTFGRADSTRTRETAVINEAFERKHFPGEDPVGKQIVFGPDNNPWRWTIVGVVGNVRETELGAEPVPLVYRCVCQEQNPFDSTLALIVRTSGDPQTATRAVEQQVYAVDRNEPVFDVRTMEQRLANSLAPQSFHLLLMGTFAGIAIVLAAVGVYGVMSYLVTRRTREIGIRIALGAQPEQVVRLVIGETFVLLGIAIFAGLAGAWGLTRYLTAMLYGITPLDVVSFATMPILLAAIAIAASFAPAHAASQTDPTVALREE